MRADLEVLRAAVLGLIEEKQQVPNVRVLRATLLAEQRAPALLAAFASGTGDSVESSVTDDDGNLVFMLDESELDGPDVLG